MYVRFVKTRPRGRVRLRVGIIRSDDLSRGDDPAIDAIWDWLNSHLPRPPRGVFEGGRGLCWFRHDAEDCIEQVGHLAFILERRGWGVARLVTRSPGWITYQDDWQIVAVPDACLDYVRV